MQVVHGAGQQGWLLPDAARGCSQTTVAHDQQGRQLPEMAPVCKPLLVQQQQPRQAFAEGPPVSLHRHTPPWHLMAAEPDLFPSGLTCARAHTHGQ